MTAGFLVIRSILLSSRKELRDLQATDRKQINRQLESISSSVLLAASNVRAIETQLTKSIGKTNRNVTDTRKAIDEKLAQGSLDQLSVASFQLALSQRRIEQELSSLLTQKENL